MFLCLMEGERFQKYAYILWQWIRAERLPWDFLRFTWWCMQVAMKICWNTLDYATRVFFKLLTSWWHLSLPPSLPFSLSLSLSLSVFLSLFLSLFFSLFLSLPFSLSISVFLSLCISLSLSLSLFHSLSFSLCFYTKLTSSSLHPSLKFFFWIAENTFLGPDLVNEGPADLFVSNETEWSAFAAVNTSCPYP